MAKAIVKDGTNDRLAEDLKVPSGKTLTVESGGTIVVSGTATLFGTDVDALTGVGDLVLSDNPELNDVTLVSPDANPDKVQLTTSGSGGTTRLLTLSLAANGTITFTSPRQLSIGGNLTVSNNITLASDGTGTRTLNIAAGGTLASGAFQDLSTWTGSTSITTIGTQTTVNFSLGSRTYAATVDLDLSSNAYETVSLTGNITFTTSNRASVRSKTIRIVSDSSSRTLAFPAGWKWVGAAAPSSIAASKTAILTITAFGTAEADIVAAYAVEP